MTMHGSEWLAAYHDGEMMPDRRRQVEEHLQGCPACRAELDALERLSSLVLADRLPAGTPPQRFAAQVQLRLPRPARLPTRGAGRLPRWVLGAPLALIAAWAFLQAGLRVTSLALAAGWVLDWQAPPIGSSTASDGLLGWALDLAPLEAALLAGTAVLLSAWMALWWAWNKHPGTDPSTNHIQKEV
jgi:anti-sigma factor RsiW